MIKAVAPMMFKVIIALILGILVLAIFIRGISEAIYGACWNGAKTALEDLKDGQNQVIIGSCIANVYISNRESLPRLQQYKADFYKCSQRENAEYDFFIILKPNTAWEWKDIADPVGAVQKKFLEDYCVEKKYRLNSFNKGILNGGKTYCIVMSSVGGNPNMKNLDIREGRC